MTASAWPPRDAPAASHMPSSNRLNWLLTRERRAETPLARRILAFEPVPIGEFQGPRLNDAALFVYRGGGAPPMPRRRIHAELGTLRAPTARRRILRFVPTAKALSPATDWPGDFEADSRIAARVEVLGLQNGCGNDPWSRLVRVPVRT